MIHYFPTDSTKRLLNLVQRNRITYNLSQMIWRCQIWQSKTNGGTLSLFLCTVNKNIINIRTMIVVTCFVRTDENFNFAQNIFFRGKYEFGREILFPVVVSLIFQKSVPTTDKSCINLRFYIEINWTFVIESCGFPVATTDIQIPKLYTSTK